MQHPIPISFPVKVLTDESSEDGEHDLVFVQIGTILWDDNKTHPLVIELTIDDMTITITTLFDCDVDSDAQDTGQTLTREQVMTLYCKLIREADDYVIDDIEQRVMTAADLCIARIAFAQADMYVDSIGYLKVCISKGLTFNLIEDELQDRLEKVATARLRDHKARIIQGYFRIAISNPTYEMCKRRLLYEFEQYSHDSPCPLCK